MIESPLRKCVELGECKYECEFDIILQVPQQQTQKPSLQKYLKNIDSLFDGSFVHGLIDKRLVVSCDKGS